MEPRSLGFICEACGGELRGDAGQMLVHGVSTDTRQIRPQDLFFAIKGERFDAHEFLPVAAEKGAAAFVIDRLLERAESLGKPVIVAQNTRDALGRFAARYRNDFRPRMVVVAGSNGKTSTKELIASVLRQKFQTLWSEASFNNDIGVPLTLLRLESTHQAAVLEAGTNHPGELAPLVRMIQPELGVITNIGREHLEFFGGLEGVAQEEGWVADLLPQTGKLFVNGDNPWTPGIVERAKAGAIRVGLGPGNAWRAGKIRVDANGSSFEVSGPRQEYNGEYRLRLLGRHQVSNALFAVALGAEFGVSPAQIRQGLAVCQPAKMRLQIFEAAGVTYLDDTYNANADSVRAALETLRDYPGPGRRIAVLGPMAELGTHAPEAHEEAGRYAAETGVDRLLAIGPWAEILAQGARKNSLRETMIAPDLQAAVGILHELVQPGDLVLLKASRSAGFERLTAALKGKTI